MQNVDDEVERLLDNEGALRQITSAPHQTYLFGLDSSVASIYRKNQEHPHRIFLVRIVLLENIEHGLNVVIFRDAPFWHCSRRGSKLKVNDTVGLKVL